MRYQKLLFPSTLICTPVAALNWSFSGFYSTDCSGTQAVGWGGNQKSNITIIKASAPVQSVKADGDVVELNKCGFWIDAGVGGFNASGILENTWSASIPGGRCWQLMDVPEGWGWFAVNGPWPQDNIRGCDGPPGGFGIPGQGIPPHM